ncbi:MAG: acetyl-CoA carboxylase biotin carboxyl carrier protein [Elusimicrobiota bacterium]
MKKREAKKMYNISEIKDLMRFVERSSISEIEISSEKERIVIKKGQAQTQPLPLQVFQPVAHSVESHTLPPSFSPPLPIKVEKTAETASEDMSGFHAIKSPIVGTFYESPKPGVPPFVKEGDSVKKGQVVCIVEAMKIMNEIQADVTGKIVKKCVKNEQPVEYGQIIFYVKEE